MFKKIISIILTVVAVCSLAFSVYADEPDCLTNGHTFVDPPGIMKGFDGEIQGFPVSISIKYCPKCKFYFHECNVLGIQLEYMSLTGFTGIDGELQAFLFTQIGRIMGKNATATQFQSGGGSASPGGVGRNPAGYFGQGMPTVNSSGICFLSVPVDGVYFSDRGYNNWVSGSNYKSISESSSYYKKSFFAGTLNEGNIPRECYIYYSFTVPADGVYFLGNLLNGYSICDFVVYPDDHSPIQCSSAFHFSDSQSYLYAKHFNKGDVAFFSFYFTYSNYFNASDYSVSIFTSTLFKYHFLPLLLCFEPDPTDTSINKQTNITINNNTFNGNIYVDNTNKLTYIYPQYTVNNETKISNNPIIYNEETKQYYTYDQTTNNYYYITYNVPTPTPTPTPDPTPTPTPDPGKPTPTPTPGGSGGGSGDTNNFWNIIFPNFSDDGTDSGHKGIFWALVSLILAIIAFFTNMLAGYKYLFPFLPDGVVMTINACVFVLFLFVVIKFIMRSK